MVSGSNSMSHIIKVQDWVYERHILRCRAVDGFWRRRSDARISVKMKLLQNVEGLDCFVSLRVSRAMLVVLNHSLTTRDCFISCLQAR